jgi:hypothetical protein
VAVVALGVVVRLRHLVVGTVAWGLGRVAAGAVVVVVVVVVVASEHEMDFSRDDDDRR